MIKAANLPSIKVGVLIGQSSSVSRKAYVLVLAYETSLTAWSRSCTLPQAIKIPSTEYLKEVTIMAGLAAV